MATICVGRAGYGSNEKHERRIRGHAEYCYSPEISIFQWITAVGKLKGFFKYIVSASFVGIVISLLGLYYELRGNVTHMSMDIAAESNVLDVLHPMPDLSILFQGRDIVAEKSNLKILTVRVVNDGSANILENDFDRRTPFGLWVEGGRVIRAQVVGGNSAYLTENIHPLVEGTDRIVLDKVIFDKGKFVSLEVLVLHPKGSEPNLKPLGKIAGLEQISITRSFEDHSQRSFMDQVFSGPLAVQISRGITYTILALISVISLGLLIAGLASIPGKRAKRKRQRVADQLPVLDSPSQEKKRKAVEGIYIEYGLEGLNRAQRLLGNEEHLKNEMLARRAFYGGSVALDITGEEMAEIHHRMAMRAPSSLTPLVAAKLLTLKGETLQVDPDVRQLLAEYVSQISGEDDNPVEPPAG
jgi:hypothetical protein